MSYKTYFTYTCYLNMSITNILKYLFIVFYLIAGINHFIHPQIYYPLIPKYLSNYAVWINIAAGIAEVMIAVLMMSSQTIKLSSTLAIAMLLAFIPSHIYFIQAGNLVIGNFLITPFIAWIRLLIIHPLLIYWAWWLGKQR